MGGEDTSRIVVRRHVSLWLRIIIVIWSLPLLLAALVALQALALVSAGCRSATSAHPLVNVISFVCPDSVGARDAAIVQLCLAFVLFAVGFFMIGLVAALRPNVQWTFTPDEACRRRSIGFYEKLECWSYAEIAVFTEVVRSIGRKEVSTITLILKNGCRLRLPTQAQVELAQALKRFLTQKIPLSED